MGPSFNLGLVSLPSSFLGMGFRVGAFTMVRNTLHGLSRSVEPARTLA